MEGMREQGCTLCNTYMTAKADAALTTASTGEFSHNGDLSDGILPESRDPCAEMQAGF